MNARLRLTALFFGILGLVLGSCAAPSNTPSRNSSGSRKGKDLEMQGFGAERPQAPY